MWICSMFKVADRLQYWKSFLAITRLYRINSGIPKFWDWANKIPLIFRIKPKCAVSYFMFHWMWMLKWFVNSRGSAMMYYVCLVLAFRSPSAKMYLCNAMWLCWLQALKSSCYSEVGYCSRMKSFICVLSFTHTVCTKLRLCLIVF